MPMLSPAPAASAGGEAANIIIPMILSSAQVNLNEGTGAKQPLYTCPATFNGVAVGGCVIENILGQKFSGTGTVFAFSLGWDAGASNLGSVDVSGFGGVTATKMLNLAVGDISNVTSFLLVPAVIGAPGDVLGLAVANPEGSPLTGRVQPVGYFLDTNGVAIPNVAGIAP